MLGADGESSQDPVSILTYCKNLSSRLDRVSAEKLIFEQIERLKKGDFTNAQIESAKNKKINRLISISDGQASLVNYNSVNLIMGSRDTIDERIEKVKKITKKMIVSAATSVKHDATVFICGLEKKGDEAK